MSHPDSPHSAPAELDSGSIPISQTSDLTSSDKLSALPSLQRISSSTRSQPARSFRRSFDSLPLPDGSPSKRVRELSGQSLSDGDTPKRVSFEGERPEISALRRDASAQDESTSPPRPRSRAASPSPLRQFITRAVTPRRNDEPFIPYNPFSFPRKIRKFTQNHAIHSHSPSFTPECKSFFSSISWSSIRSFCTDTAPRQVYLYVLLGLPLLYFSRVARVFIDADVSRPDIQRMINTCGEHGSGFRTMETISVSPMPDTRRKRFRSSSVLPFPDQWNYNSVSPSLLRFKDSWEVFIDSVLREWKTLNVVSALLVSAILTLFQIPAIFSDPITRTFCLLALLSSLIALSFGCMFIVRFAAMRSMVRAARWANDARKGSPRIFWNVWVMLSMPAVWLAWSMIFFIAAILALVWRTGSVNDPDQRDPLTESAANGLRVVVTALLLLGLVYLALIIKTLRKYGRRVPGRPDLDDDHYHDDIIIDAKKTSSPPQDTTPAPTPERRGRQRVRKNLLRGSRKASSDPGTGSHRRGKLWGLGLGFSDSHHVEPDLEKGEGNTIGDTEKKS